MIICICGSRDYKRLDRVDAFVAALPADTFVISGGARGVDRRAYYRAMLRARAGTLMGAEEIKADWERYGRKAGMIRNQQMVDRCDGVVAFWDRKSSGTYDSIRRAYAAKKLHLVFGPDGAIPAQDIREILGYG